MLRPARFILTALILGLAILLAGCTIATKPPTVGVSLSGDQAAAGLVEARAAWATRQPFYTYELSRLCQCPADDVGPYRLTVVDGIVCVITPLDPQITEVPADLYAPTIPALLDLVAQALERGELDRVTFTDDGLPSELVIDPDPSVTDDELFLRAVLVTS